MKKLLKQKVNLIELSNYANRLAQKAKLGDIFLLSGELGVGKTTFVRFFIESIYKRNFLKKPKFIKSPSFPILITYPIKNYEILHYDLFRIKNNNELIELNIQENIKNNIYLIEWPEMLLKKAIFKNYYLINLKIINKNNRLIEVIHQNKNFLL